jgi:antitoxin ChpS
MSRYALRKAGGSVMVTVPPAFLKKTGLRAGSAVEVDAAGDRLIITPAKSRITLTDILEAAPKDARRLRAKGWDEMQATGNEA